MKENRIKVGIIGLGRAGWGMHVTELLQFKDMFEITAVCDVDFRRATAIRERLGRDVHCWRTHGELIADPEVELVVEPVGTVEPEDLLMVELVVVHHTLVTLN